MMTATDTQHMRALANANAIRINRARLRAHTHTLPLGDGRERVAQLLDRREPLIQSMPVVDLLCWPFRAQRRIALEQVRHAGVVSRDRRVRDLTDRQVSVLVALLVGDAEYVEDSGEWAAA